MQRGTSTLREWLALIARRWRVGLITTGVVFAGLGAWQYFLGTRYAAETRFDPDRPDPMTPVLAKVVEKPAADKLLPAADVEALFNRSETAEAVLEKLPREGSKAEPFKGLNAEALRSMLSIESRSDGTLSIRATGTSEPAARLLAETATAVLEMQINNELKVRITRFVTGLTAQHKTAILALGIANAELSVTKSKNEMIQADSSVDGAVARLTTDVAVLTLQQKVDEETHNTLTGVLSSPDPQVLARGTPEDNRVVELLIRRRVADDTLAQLRRRYEDEYPEVQSAIEELAEIDTTLEATRRTVCREALQKASEAVEHAKAQISVLQRKVSKILGERTDISGAFLKVESAARQAQAIATTISELELEHSLVSLYRYSDGAVSARTVHHWTRFIALFALVALLLGLGAAYLRESLDESVRDPLHVSTHGRLDVLGTIPTITHEDINLADVERPTAHAETYTRLATVLGKQLSLRHGKTLSITSASPGEGKSTVASNLAVALARLGKATVIVDADLRNPRQHDYFRVDNRTGLSSLLERKESARAFLDSLESEPDKEGLLIGDLRALAARGEEPPAAELPTPTEIPKIPEEEIKRVLIETEVDRLWVIPAGPSPTNTGGLLEAAWFDGLLMYLKENYTYIIIDTPPVRGAADAMIVGRKADATLLVVRAGQTRRQDIRGTRRYLVDSGATIVGAVLNFNGDHEVAYSAYIPRSAA